MIVRPPHHSRAARRGAFTLLEVLIVVAMIGVLAGLSVSSFSRGSIASKQRQIAGSLVAQLRLARADALLSGQPAQVVLRADQQRTLALSRTEGEAEKSWELPGDGALTLIPGIGEPAMAVEITFSATGRCSMRTFAVRSAASGGTIFTIEFDPISGEPRLESREKIEQGGDS